MEENLRSIIFYHIAEYCDYSSKLTLKVKGNEIRQEMWDSMNKTIDIKDFSYRYPKIAYKEFERKVGSAVLGGWKILNAIPQRETWETKRSK